jgi:hypothetical protein
MRLNYGEIIKYLDKGFGFIKPLEFDLDFSTPENVFFHIKKVKHLYIDSDLLAIEKGLPNRERIFLWYTTESNEGKVSVVDCWLDSAAIPQDLLSEFATEAANFLIIRSTNKTPPPAMSSAPVKDSSKKIENVLAQYKFTKSEPEEILRYIEIYKENKFKEHYEVNNYITINDKWDEFKSIRALNDHGQHKKVRGINRKAFAAVCEILEITDAGGEKLTNSDPY